jgi:DNA-binding NtrC family response regulator
MRQKDVLVVDDEKIARDNLVHVLKREGLTTDYAVDGDEAARKIGQTRYSLVLTDLKMPGMDGLSLLSRIKDRSPGTEVIVITAHASTESAVDAMREGAFYYIEKPFRFDNVRQVVKEAIGKARLREENASLRTELSLYARSTPIVTNSPAMKEALAVAMQIAPTDCSVMVSGETGTGKEVVARFIHDNSSRKSGPFVAINCGALSESLLANELFGHEKGAYTGANETKTGLVEAAATGTLFLDEVTEMVPDLQVKLLRLLQEREFFRVGGTTPIQTDIRVITATNRDPAQAVKEGHLRQDLFYRLNVVQLQLPPLRDRRGDIPVLATHFLEKASRRIGKAAWNIDREAYDLLLAHDYPGNVRELENVIEGAVAMSSGDTITQENLPLSLRTRSGSEPDKEVLTLDEIEKAHILKVLEHTSGNKLAAAKLLGIDRVSLWRKLRQYELP